MKKKAVSILCAVVLAAGMLAGCGSSQTAGTEQEQAAEEKENATETETKKDTVVVTMPTTSEPESGFDPAYGWGAGEHVHEPLIQSTLTTTTKDLKKKEMKLRLFQRLYLIWT